MNKTILCEIFLAMCLMLGCSSIWASQKYYISSTGDDAANGLSEATAWKTFRNVNSKEFKAGDQILLKRGDKWIGEITPKGSGSEEQPILIGAYGEGEKPFIDGQGHVKAVVYLRNQSNWTIENLEVTNAAPERGYVYRNGIFVENDNAGVQRNIKILNNYVHHVTSSFRYSYEFHPHQFGGISVNVSHTGKGTDKFHNVLIEGNTVENVGRTGIVVWDHAFTKYDEASIGVVIRKNSVKDTDSDGILSYGCDGALIEYNVCNGAGSYREDGGFNGSAGIWCTRGKNCIIQYNEAYNTRKLEGNADGMGFDIDMDAIDCIVQYNYSHDNDGGFMLIIDGSFSSGSIVRYNISQNDKSRVFMLAGGMTPNTKIYNNTIYIKEGLDTKLIDHEWDDGGDINAPWIFKNNLIYNFGSGEIKIPGTGGIFSHNIYYGKHPSGEPNEPTKIIKDPLLQNPGTGTFGLNSLSGYTPQKKSPALKAGFVIDHNGGKDFFGSPVTVYDKPTIGAIN